VDFTAQIFSIKKQLTLVIISTVILKDEQCSINDKMNV